MKPWAVFNTQTRTAIARFERQAPAIRHAEAMKKLVGPHYEAIFDPRSPRVMEVQKVITLKREVW